MAASKPTFFLLKLVVPRGFEPTTERFKIFSARPLHYGTIRNWREIKGSNSHPWITRMAQFSRLLDLHWSLPPFLSKYFCRYVSSGFYASYPRYVSATFALTHFNSEPHSYVPRDLGYSEFRPA